MMTAGAVDRRSGRGFSRGLSVPLATLPCDGCGAADIFRGDAFVRVLVCFVLVGRFVCFSEMLLEVVF